MKSPRPFGTGGVPATVVRRRTVLRGMLGAGAVAGLGGLTACGGGDEEVVTFGSNGSDDAPKKAYAAEMAEFPGPTVEINTVDHNTFQENINSYLKGGADDVFTWFAGNRMRYFAAQNLVGDISDVWGEVGDGFSAAMKDQSTAEDGKQYFVPHTYYPWAVFYRKSVWRQHDYEPPSTLDELVALAKRMRSDNLVPIAFGDSDGWPAMGTFDYLNMRINGYDFHIELMEGQRSWTSPEVRSVFDTWRGLLPYHQTDSLGRTWQEAGQSLLRGDAGMYLLGLFVGEQFPDEDRDDLDFFPFPEVDSAVGTDAVEAPIDGFMMASRPRNENGARELLKYLASAEAETIYLERNPNFIGAHNDIDTGLYSDLQIKSAELVGSAAAISQFMDRDTLPEFASTVMIPSLQEFIRDPSDIDGLTRSIEEQKSRIFSD